MQKPITTNSPSTLTHKAQSSILRKHLRAFVKAQAKATEALQAVNAIALCESEGNPLRRALMGTESVLSYARNGEKMFIYNTEKGYREIPDSEVEAFNILLTHSQQTLEASGYWASND